MCYLFKVLYMLPVSPTHLIIYGELPKVGAAHTLIREMNVSEHQAFCATLDQEHIISC